MERDHRVCGEYGLQTAQFLATGPIPVEEVLPLLEAHGIPTLGGDLAEGLVYRVETLPISGKKAGVNFLAKYVRPGRIVGGYLPGIGDNAPDAAPLWNWQDADETEFKDTHSL